MAWQRITTATMKPESEAISASYVIATRIGQVRSRVKLRSFGVRVFKSSIHGSEDAPNRYYFFYLNSLIPTLFQSRFVSALHKLEMVGVIRGS